MKHASAVLVALFASMGWACNRPASAQAADVVRAKDGREFRGRVLAETYERIELSIRRGASKSVPWEIVESVDYDAPTRFSEAEELVANGRLEEALSIFESMMSDRSLRRPLRQEAHFQVAALNQRLGRPDLAAAGYQALVDEYPISRYLDEAARGLVEYNLERGAAGAAARALDRIESGARAANLGDRFAARADLLRGRILEAQDQLAEARARYEAIRRREDLDIEERGEATLGIARVLQAQGSREDAEARYREMVMGEFPPIVLAGAWNGLADIALDGGFAARDRQRITEALVCFLRSIVLYLPEEGDPLTEFRRAIHGAAKSCDYLSQLASDARTKAVYRYRAASLRARISQK